MLNIMIFFVFLSTGLQSFSYAKNGFRAYVSFKLQYHRWPLLVPATERLPPYSECTYGSGRMQMRM